MENIIITQKREIAVNMRHIHFLEVAASRTAPGIYDVVANFAQNAVIIGSFSNKDMAMDVRNDIILWNNNNYNWETEYTVPQDKPIYQSTTDATSLPAAKRLIGDSSVQNNKAAT